MGDRGGPSTPYLGRVGDSESQDARARELLRRECLDSAATRWVGGGFICACKYDARHVRAQGVYLCWTPRARPCASRHGARRPCMPGLIGCAT
jgi:hypothetical protein